MKAKLSAFLILMIVIALMLPQGTLAGNKPKRAPKPKKKVVLTSRHKAKPKVIVKLPPKHKKIVVKEKNFFFHAGAWYKHGPAGYKVVVAPRGARIKVLPANHRIIIVGGKKFFHYYGTYYLYDTTAAEYYVVDAPVEKQTADILTLVDGEVLHGRYLGGNDETVEFLVGDDVHEISVTDIVSLLFEPPSE